MKHTLALTLFVFLVGPLAALRAADDSRVAELKAADDQRVAVMKSPDRQRLNAIFSDELRYAHSTGAVDTKTSFIDVLVSGKTKYVSYDYEERNVTFPARDIGLISGRAHIRAVNATATMDNVLSFLAVWRLENGKWRFLAWQSCKLPVAQNP